MSHAHTITHWVRRLRDGDPRAPEKLFAYYARRLIRLAQQHLSRKMASRIDGDDVVQSVFRTFFRRHARGEFEIDNSTKFWRLLVKITLLKARAKGRHHTAALRDIRAEADVKEQAWWHEVVARDPEPAEAVALVDLIESLLRNRPPLFRQVLEMRLQGLGATEIARQLQISRQNVYQVLRQLQERLEHFICRASN
jgi:RNA polymerase sigma-70 factor (ECF subfamily)